MSRHGEKIRKRKDGRWEGRYKIGNSKSGTTQYASVYGHSYAEVKVKLEEKVVENTRPTRLDTPLFKNRGQGDFHEKTVIHFYVLLMMN